MSQESLDLSIVLDHLRQMDEITISSAPGESSSTPEISTRVNSILKNSRYSYPLDYLVFSGQTGCAGPISNTLIRYMDRSIMNVAEGSTLLSCFPHRIYTSNPENNEIGSYKINYSTKETFYYKKGKLAFTLRGDFPQKGNSTSLGDFIPFKEFWSCFSKQPPKIPKTGKLLLEHLSGICDHVGTYTMEDVEVSEYDGSKRFIQNLTYNLKFPEWMSSEDKLLFLGGIMHKTSKHRAE